MTPDAGRASRRSAGSPARRVAGRDRALVAARPPLLVVADFDGTLARGTRDPAGATSSRSPSAPCAPSRDLAADRPGRVRVAVLTGRIVTDVASRVRVGGIEYLGDHGLQRAPSRARSGAAATAVTTTRRSTGHTRPAEILAAGVAAELGAPPWLFVERKGPSVAFHVRQADDVAAARAAVLAAIASVETRERLDDHGLAHYRGRSVVDLRPASPAASAKPSSCSSSATRPGRPSSCSATR